MSNISLDIDCAKAILKTYQQINDSSFTKSKRKRQALAPKNIEDEFNQLQVKYLQLQNELNSKEELLARVNRQLLDSTCHLEKLQEDFENAIVQFTNLRLENRPQ